MRIYTKKAICKRGHFRTPDNLYGSSMCKQCMKERVRVVEKEKSREHYKQNAQKILEDSARRSAALKLEVLTHYGPLGKLGCCWEACSVVDIDMLSLDHIKNDGAQHRRQLGTKRACGEKVYRIVKREGYQEGFQTLCMNHQLKKKIEKDRSDRLLRNGERFGTQP